MTATVVITILNVISVERLSRKSNRVRAVVELQNKSKLQLCNAITITIAIQ